MQVTENYQQMEWSQTLVLNLDNYFEFFQGHPKTMILYFPFAITFANKPTTPLALVITQMLNIRKQFYFPPNHRGFEQEQLNVCGYNGTD